MSKSPVVRRSGLVAEWHELRGRVRTALGIGRLCCAVSIASTPLIVATNTSAQTVFESHVTLYDAVNFQTTASHPCYEIPYVAVGPAGRVNSLYDIPRIHDAVSSLRWKLPPGVTVTLYAAFQPGNHGGPPTLELTGEGEIKHLNRVPGRSRLADQFSAWSWTGEYTHPMPPTQTGQISGDAISAAILKMLGQGNELNFLKVRFDSFRAIADSWTIDTASREVRTGNILITLPGMGYGMLNGFESSATAVVHIAPTQFRFNALSNAVDVEFSARLVTMGDIIVDNLHTVVAGNRTDQPVGVRPIDATIRFKCRATLNGLRLVMKLVSWDCGSVPGVGWVARTCARSDCEVTLRKTGWGPNATASVSINEDSGRWGLKILFIPIRGSFPNPIKTKLDRLMGNEFEVGP